MQRWLVTHKKIIIKLWYAALIAWLLFFLVSTQLLSIRHWLWLGEKAANFSLIVFWITLTPGIMKRFGIGGWLLPVRTVLMLYRRQLGITMYLLALAHYWWSRTLPLLSVGGDITLFSPFEIMGLAAFLLLTPLFFTSNDWSLKHFGRWWNTIHSLVYIIIWLVFLHVAMQELGVEAFITLMIAALELFSLLWDRVLRPQKTKNIQNP